MKRGDNIPSVSEYAHWNEEAESMWYAENRYDMEHWDEEIDEPDEDFYEPDDEDEEIDASWVDGIVTDRYL